MVPHMLLWFTHIWLQIYGLHLFLHMILLHTHIWLPIYGLHLFLYMICHMHIYDCQYMVWIFPIYDRQFWPIYGWPYMCPYICSSSRDSHVANIWSHVCLHGLQTCDSHASTWTHVWVFRHVVPMCGSVFPWDDWVTCLINQSLHYNTYLYLPRTMYSNRLCCPSAALVHLGTTSDYLT